MPARQKERKPEDEKPNADWSVPPPPLTTQLPLKPTFTPSPPGTFCGIYIYIFWYVVIFLLISAHFVPLGVDFRLK